MKKTILQHPGSALFFAATANLRCLKTKRVQEDFSGGEIPNAISIDERLAVVEDRSRLGDWEMDTVIGRASGSVLVTKVERLNRLTIIA
jgi:IS30 family transposase